MHHKYRQKTKIKHADLPDLEQTSKGAKVHCPGCAVEVPVSDINIVDMVGKCHSCNSIFSFAQTVQQLLASSDDLITDDIGRPEGIELNYFQDELEISAKQEFPVLDTILACVAPFTSLIGLGMFVGEGWIGGLFLMIASLLVFVYSVVKLIRSKRNRIYINIDHHRVEVIFRPKNWVKDKSFSTGDIEQVFVKADPVMGGHAVFLVVNGVVGQSQKRLIGGIKSLLKAKYIEQEIERHLEIPNKKIAGEM